MARLARTWRDLFEHLPGTCQAPARQMPIQRSAQRPNPVIMHVIVNRIGNALHTPVACVNPLTLWANIRQSKPAMS